LGQKRTFRNVRAMSALPPKADMDQEVRNVRFVQKRTYETPTFRALLVKGSGLDPLLTGSSTDEALPLCLGIATARPFRRSI
jgi:hypothetical protein